MVESPLAMLHHSHEPGDGSSMDPQSTSGGASGDHHEAQWQFKRSAESAVTYHDENNYNQHDVYVERERRQPQQSLQFVRSSAASPPLPEVEPLMHLAKYKEEYDSHHDPSSGSSAYLHHQLHSHQQQQHAYFYQRPGLATGPPPIESAHQHYHPAHSQQGGHHAVVTSAPNWSSTTGATSHSTTAGASSPWSTRALPTDFSVNGHDRDAAGQDWTWTTPEGNSHREYERRMP